MALRAVCLCDGYGGFELAIRLLRAAHRIDIRTVARVERDSHAAAVLVARMEEATLDQAPIWDDLTTFDGAAWRGRVDLVTAGFPCQPFSQAGLRAGVDDDRWLWPDIARVVADMGPNLVFLENVPGLVRHGLPHVLADLADLGFDAEWERLGADECGAPHQRDRVWIMAHRNGGRRQGVRQLAGGAGRRLDRDADGRLPDVGDTRRPRRPEDTGSTPGDESRDAGRATHTDHVTHRAGEGVADTAGIGQREPHPQERPVARQRTRRDAGGGRLFPPGRDDRAGWVDYLAARGPEPSLRRGAHGRPPELAEQLHLGGNGLVPLVAAHAFLRLARRLDLDLPMTDRTAL